ncbi:MAG: hypothetical protein JF619_06325 [Massilia sp.]|nr:hypothetical protein [Massilia sp.]
MHPHLHALLLRVCALAALAPHATVAWADPAQDASRAAARALFRPENAIGAQAPSRTDASGSPLAQQRGGTDTRDDMRLDGSVAANTAVNVVTGANSIDAGSFANMAGIPVVIQNSGANVLIQNATIINLQLK